MTDMKISDGAVKWWLQDNCCGAGQCQTRVEDCEALDVSPAEIRDVHYGLELMLIYYAEHPEELPQEVRDAVRGINAGGKRYDWWRVGYDKCHKCGGQKLCHAKGDNPPTCNDCRPLRDALG